MNNDQNYVELQVADSNAMAAYTAFPENLKADTPAIIILQEAFGVNSHIRKVADRFAAEGYIAIAPELFHRTAPKGFAGDYADFSTVTPHTSQITNEGLEADLQAVWQWLGSQSNVNIGKVYAIGYCMGGRVSFIANALLPLKAAVSYYGGGLDKIANRAADLHGKHLFFWGGKDAHIKQDLINTVIAAVDDAGKDYINVKISYADHGFNCDERPSYNKAASTEAWALTLAFLEAESQKH
ncbi:dienelactone hydrolase family protein [Mucilaginibacter sp. SP1R1]|uniref:dienelactone hydrolase family protein n=1 Tax=Mucilaginibacter sp. SP1R1 TaxID=2723091 RepID=UPI00161814A5|nr:dienelactone hydrolase family protein [Mucilaginibacter sp. SP1R1]MBB6147743.1 carboxymethylenebutenolidase [Mucilaginibacter sp. SP1R1]